MKKLLATVFALLLSVSCLSACDKGEDSSSSSTGDNTMTKQYISTFDWYRDCLVIPVTSWTGHLVEEGLIETEWNQEETAYISEGVGSCRVTTREATTRYKGYIMTNSEVVSVNDINGATLISLDVYNPGNVAIDVSVDVVCGLKTVVSAKQTCGAKGWTTVSATIEEGTYDKVKSYALTLENKVNDETFTLYLDNFYVEYAK
jgi:hypothetical protein